jgi:hypothetical protein
LIERGEFQFSKQTYGVDVARSVGFRFMKYHLVKANVVPETGDVVLYNEEFYKVDSVNENQFILGKDPNYSYEENLELFGDSYSIILTCHLASPDSLGIKQNRL